MAGADDDNAKANSHSALVGGLATALALHIH